MKAFDDGKIAVIVYDLWLSRAVLGHGINRGKYPRLPWLRGHSQLLARAFAAMLTLATYLGDGMSDLVFKLLDHGEDVTWEVSNHGIDLLDL